mmetsp:Transcript_26294/g.44369  ORF Transcript_26294/g.44369 Transcript_26294/m.44369 type:complete len:747 (-) Transcript_26294:2537-4777(-)
MLGAGENNPEEFGLIPRVCFSLYEYFETMAQEKGVRCSMEFSFLQIYNENLRDCLAPNSSTILKVREHPKEGSYVANLTTVQVTKFEDILSLMAIGNKSRAVASTRANVQSSRSHGIIVLTVRQRYRNDSVPGSTIQQKVSRIHLVDLAGSERSSHSGAVGERLKEANNINKSLSVLGDVIKCLGESSKRSSQKRTGHIPYRNSVLTMVLRHSLGGNSRTTMVAAVSPSSADYDETISTLKYADNVKKVRNRVAVNISSDVLASEGAMQLVPVLQAEVQKLREMLQTQQTQQSLTTNISLNDEDTIEIMEEMHARVSELELQLKDRESLIKSLELSVGEHNSPVPFSALTASASVDRSLDSSVRSQPFIVLADDAVDTTLPRVINLNQDPLFSECLVYYIPDGVAIAGCDEMDVDILLSGPDILSKHCLLHNDHDRVWIEPACPKSKVYVNGKLLVLSKLVDHVYLSHFDRISIGRYHLFRFEAKGKSRAISPMKKSKSGAISSNFNTEAPGWDFAHDELMLNKDSLYITDSTKSSSDFSDQYFDQLTLDRIQKTEYAQTVSRNSNEAEIHPSTRVKLSSFDGNNFDEDEIVGLWESVNTVIEGSQQVESSTELRERVKKIVEHAESKIKRNQPKKVQFVSEVSETDEVVSQKAIVSTRISTAQSPVMDGLGNPHASATHNMKKISQKIVSSPSLSTREDLDVESKIYGELKDVVFEDEASSLQRDMLQMQEKLAQRMKRYTSSSV